MRSPWGSLWCAHSRRRTLPAEPTSLHMRSILLAVVLASAVLAPTAYAQGVQTSADGLPTLVTYTLRAIVPAGDAAVPDVVTRLASDENLTRLDVASRLPMNHSAEAEFVFGTVAGFAAWRQSAAVSALVRDLEVNSHQGVEVSVNVRRHLPGGLRPESD